MVQRGGSTRRIKSSPIQMLKAISSAARTRRKINKKLLITIKNNAGLIRKCPAEEIRCEFDKILMSKKPSRYFKLMYRLGLLSIIAPEVTNCVGVAQDSKYHKWDVFTHLIYTVDNCDPNLTIRLAGLLHDVGKVSTKREVLTSQDKKVTFHKHEIESAKLARSFLRRLKYDLEIIRKVILLVRLHMYHYTREWTDSTIKKFIKRVGLTEEYMTEERISYFPLFRLRAAERLGSGYKNVAVTDRQKDFEKRVLKVYKTSGGIDVNDLKINGHVIMDTFNLPGGREIGDIKRFLLVRVMENPELNNELDLLKLVAEYMHIRRT